MGGTSFAPVPGFSKYVVSSDGRIYGPRRELRGALSIHGYLRVSMMDDEGDKRNQAVHRVVLTSFVGPALAGTQCAHLDGDSTNNELSNLAWCTPSENHAHKRRHGTTQSGERNGNSKLRESQVLEMKARLRNGESPGVVGPAFGVDRTTARCIRDGKTWKHVT